MRWQGRKQSETIEDRRGSRLSRGVGLGGIGTVVVILIALYTGQDPTTLLQNVEEMTGGGQTQSAQGPYQESAA